MYVGDGVFLLLLGGGGTIGRNLIRDGWIAGCVGFGGSTKRDIGKLCLSEDGRKMG